MKKKKNLYALARALLRVCSQIVVVLPGLDSVSIGADCLVIPLSPLFPPLALNYFHLTVSLLPL